MTARRALVAALHTALGAAVLAAVVGVLWVVGSAVMGPNAPHSARAGAGMVLALGCGSAMLIAYHVGRAIADAIAERRR